ncbi:MAG: alkaline phosphatase D family protein [Burkholderiaceae bacterium]
MHPRYDDRQYRDPQACPRPGRRLQHRARERPPGRCSTRAAACSGRRGALAGAELDPQRAELLAQQMMVGTVAPTPRHRPTGPTAGTATRSARKRFAVVMVVERKVPGVVVLGGDVHAHFVADLKTDFDDARAPVVASEFCGTSIASHGMAQQRLTAGCRTTRTASWPCS